MPNKQLNFLMLVFSMIANNQGFSHVIYPIFQSNLLYLNNELALLLQAWIVTKFTEVNENKEEKQVICRVIGDFGRLIQHFPLGNRDANLEIAIASYQIILTTINCVTNPKLWAATQNSMAIAYQDRISGDTSDNLEKSIECCLSALTVETRQDCPKDWAAIKNNLATAYLQKIRGDFADNIEQSIEHFESILEVYTQHDFPEQWAGTQHNLAIAYKSLIRGSRADNLDKSIGYYQAALEVRNKQFFPEDWSTTQNNLANAYHDRITGNRADNLERAIECHRLALDVRTRQAFPEDWATTQINLANVYSDRIIGNRADNLKLSIEYSQAALHVYTRETSPERWATTQNNLALTYQKIDRIDESIECFKSALTIRTPQISPLNCLQTANNLGNLAFAQNNWQLAIESYDLAIQAVEISRGWAREENRQEILHNAISVYQNAIQACINHGQIGKAIEYSERARSRQLVDFMATNDLYRDGEIPAQVKIYLAEYESLQHQIYQQQRTETTDDNRQLTTTTRDSRAMLQVSAKIGELEAQKQTVWLKIRSIDPQFAEQQQVTPIDLTTIQQLITTNTTAILSFYTTDNDTQIFIITRDNEPQIYTCQGEGFEQLQEWLRMRWAIPYMFKSQSPEEQAAFKAAFKEFAQANEIDSELLEIGWIDRIQPTLTQLSQRLQLAQLIEKLPHITELIIIPHLYLHQIPFAAIPLLSEGRRSANGGVPINPLLGGVPEGWGGSRVDDESQDNELLGDKFTIRLIPSCQILQYCKDRSPITTPQYGTVENADGTLPGAGFEGQQLANLFQIESDYRLQGRKQATVAAFHELIDRSTKPITTLHLANHAHSRLDNPLESAVKLADGNITLQSLMKTRYQHLREIFLSCCETNLGTTGITDDLLTLSTGFLCAGASTVIGTLWAVDDLATALFSTFYYQHRHANYSRDIALKMAQNRLRNLTGADFHLDYAEDLRANFQAYGKANKRDRADLKAEFDRGEIDKAKFNRDYDDLTNAYTKALDAAERLDDYSQQDKPFNHPYFWAGFVCQGLG
jgi:CHAT domain-containing protein/tetratricopeptide (TPR) repeat protein